MSTARQDTAVAPWERGLVLTDPRPRSIRDALHEVARALPDHIAVADGKQQLTYSEFVRATERVVSLVRATDADPNEPVTVVVAHGVDALVAIVGVIVAGYLAAPVDGRDPLQQLRSVHEAAGSALIVSDAASAVVARDVARDGPLVVIDGAVPESHAPAVDDIAIDPESVAILHFTSGSTGTPKAVARTHRYTVITALRFAHSQGLTPDDRLGVESTFGFSAAYMNAWTGLLSGVTLSCFDLRGVGVRGIPDWANRAGVTMMWLVPSVLRALTATAPDARFESVRLVNVGGEPVNGADIRRARPMFRASTVFRNRYGSAEASIICEWEITPEDEQHDLPVPVGPARPWQDLQVVDDVGEEVPDGEPGMLVVVDTDLSVGYWRDPQLTTDRFFELPDGRRGFRTSDRVQKRSDGVLEYLGRADDRMKVRGAMTSPSQVERALVELDDIAEAAVVGVPAADGGTRLVAYVVLGDGSATPSGWQIRRKLAERVPSHMVPSVVVVLDALPIGSRGKVDRGALPPAPDPALRTYREPVGRERELADLYPRVLGVDRVGLDDDFFELGGDSLAAIELIAAIDDQFGVELSAPVLLAAPTVAQLARRLVRRRSRDAPTVVPLQHFDAGTPFFCVAGGGSPATSLRALAEVVGDRPCYGIQARGLEERARPDRSVEACARRYLSEIREIQPQGPYLLGGFSFGALVAFEMACRLQAIGETVALLVIIDANAPGTTPSAGSRRSETMQAMSPAAKLQRVPRAVAGRAQLGFEFMTAGLLRRRLRQYRVFWLLSRRASRRYRPSHHFDGPALVVRASIPDPDTPRPPGPELGWQSLLRGPIATVEIPGGHVGTMRRPNVAMLGRELRDALSSSMTETRGTR